MTFEPRSKNTPEKILSLITAILSIVLFGASGVVQRFSGIYQITAFVFAILAIQIYLKYVYSRYVYKATEDSLQIYKITGKKSICVASLDYEMSISQVISYEKYLESKNTFPKTNFNVNYCKNLFPKQYSVYFFEFNGKKSMMKFEPDNEFVCYVNELISGAVNDAEDIYEN